MNSKLKATTLTLAVLSLGVCFQQFAFAYDPDVFPGAGSRDDFNATAQITNKANQLTTEGKPREAISLYKKAIARYPYCANTYYNLGNAHCDLNEYSSAVLNYQKAIKLAPDYPQAWANLSDAQFRLKDYDSAEKTATKAIAVDPKNPVAFINLAQAELALKKAKQAKRHIQVAKSLPGSNVFSQDIASIDKQLQSMLAKTAEN